MRIEHCFFCSTPCYPGHGITFARNDCKVFKFCRPKCHKAFMKKRNPRKVKWTKAFRKSHGKEMKVDSSLEFERRRNVPVRYDRELVGATLQAMKRVQAVQVVRDRRFFSERHKGAKAALKLAHRLEVAQSIDLVQPAVVRAGLRSTARLAEKAAEMNVVESAGAGAALKQRVDAAAAGARAASLKAKRMAGFAPKSKAASAGGGDVDMGDE